ncbi:hypothetical protein KJ866_01730 [Patescibacteria group bacterium]|nr:hypothetical protein [Patescibacteria group bacterium]
MLTEKTELLELILSRLPATSEKTNQCDKAKQSFHCSSLLSRYCLTASSHNDLISCYPTMLDISCQGQQKITISGVYSFLALWIKKFSSPKIKIWFEPMFFSEFFCGLQRCGSAAFPNFRGGIFSEKCVRTNSRILHHVGKVKEFWFASLRSATNLYSILGVKTNSRFRISGEENFLILNPKTI